MPVRIALKIVRFRDNGVKFVCKEPSKLVTRLVFCHNVMVDDVIALVIRWIFGSHAAKAININATSRVNTKYFGCRNIPTSVVIDS